LIVDYVALAKLTVLHFFFSFPRLLPIRCSWLWERSNTSSTKHNKNVSEKMNYDTLSNFLKQNGNDGNEVNVGGRRCPAHEDPQGFASALIELLKN